MDNHHVILPGYVGPKPETIEEKSKIKTSIYIWDIQTNKVERYSESSDLCFHDGYIYYPVLAPKSSDPERPHIKKWYEGRFGEERSYVQQFNEDEDRQWARTHVRSPLTGCRELERPAFLEGRISIPLLKNDGYLDAGESININKRDKWVNASLVRPDTGVVELPVVYMQDFNMVEYYEHRLSYLLQNTFWITAWKQTGCITVWWMSHEGKTSKECVRIIDPEKRIAERLDRMTSGAGRLTPTKEGFLLNIGTTLKSWDLVLIGDTTTRTLLSGLMHESAVSPDGCRITFSYAKDWEAVRVGGEGRRTLQMLDVCQ
jgi:hypothetical protein